MTTTNTAPFVHPTALVEDAVRLGSRTSVWDNAHLRRGAVIGSDCIVGGKTYVAGGVNIGDRCKLNAMVYVCSGVTMGDGVMVAAHATFTNDFYPRACTNDLSALRPSEMDEHTTFTTVQDGVTIGAGATIGSDLVIGRFAVVGMGATVTRSVPPYTLVVGSPARAMALVCRCGRPFVNLLDGIPADGHYSCVDCEVTYIVREGGVVVDPLDRPMALPRAEVVGINAQRQDGSDGVAPAAEMAG